MINADHQVNDGLRTRRSTNNRKTIWTYNQGVVLGGLAELYGRPAREHSGRGERNCGGDAGESDVDLMRSIIMNLASAIAGADGTQFKGIFVRNLGFV